MLRYQMLAYTSSIESFNVDASGNVVQSNGAKNWADFPYYASTADGSGNYYRLKTPNYPPPRRAGVRMRRTGVLNQAPDRAVFCPGAGLNISGIC